MENRKIIGYEIHILDNIIGRRISALCERDGLTQMQSWVIGYLYDHSDKNIFQKDLEARFHIARSTATGIIQLMEKRGFLTRESVPSDARLKRLVLTEKGISFQLSIIRNLNQIEQLLKGQISQKDLDFFFEIIHQMKQNLQNETL